MMQGYFVISEHNFTNEDINNLLYFYFPLIKSEGLTLYQYFLSIKNSNQAINYDFLEQIFKINSATFHKNRIILEAVYLIQTFYDNDSKKYIIALKKPLFPIQISKNPYLRPCIVQKITKPVYENLLAWFIKQDKKPQNSLVDLHKLANISKKFYEVFDCKKPEIQLQQQDLLLFQGVESNNAKKVLDFENYHFYLTKEKLRPRLKQILLQIQTQKDFSNHAINSVIEYCFKVNGKIIKNYIEVILDDLWKNNIKSGSDVELELSQIYQSKMKKSSFPANNFHLDENFYATKTAESTKKSTLKSEDLDWIFNELNSGEGWI
ncbi:DnaD domain protein [Mycoplasma sp. 'Moose RK']|uniref:DnaD domain protein n=1 Tax=Mycoplasma sp. 'Moose RK' TaxID=2780095 RepID=UPI0018C330F2|nr:DnaD domain protein [Mycoplasma sp. 'Moose RK']MBG0730690.1 DnaD domain protein [Mycoplasma sp. 'Moose RK']